jgi:hypothetical protein
MSVPSGKPIQPSAEFSAYAPKEQRKQPELPPPVANDADASLRRLASSSEREGADQRLPRAVQLPPVTGLPPVEGTARAGKIPHRGEAFINGLRVPPALMPERPRPPPPMREHRGNLIRPLTMFACVAAVLIATAVARQEFQRKDPRNSPAAALSDSKISPESAIIPQVTTSPTAALSQSAAPFQGAISAPSPASQNTTSSQGASSSLSLSEASPEREATAMLSPGPGGARTPPASKAVRRLDPEDIKLLMKQGERFTAAGDLATARLLFQRAAEAGDATAALAMGATYDPIVLAGLGVLGMSADLGKARSWYEKAREFGSPEASRRLELLANR